MPDCAVLFQPYNRTVRVAAGTTLLDAAGRAELHLNNLCGGDGICGRCTMLIKSGEVSGGLSGKLTREQVRQGYVLACLTKVEGDLEVEIPPETQAKEKVIADSDAIRFSDLSVHDADYTGYRRNPVIRKVYVELPQPTVAMNVADHQNVCEEVRKVLGIGSMQMGLKIIRALPAILREADFKVTVAVGLRRDVAEVMFVEGGDTTSRNYLVVVDMGTTTVVAHLVDASTGETLGAKACFNSQGTYGREVTGRIIQSERRGIQPLQDALIGDINRLVEELSLGAGVDQADITAVMCAGNTVMGHFLLGLHADNIRRPPYTPVTVEPPPLRASEVGIEINPRGLMYSLPGIGGWVGSDLTAGILATGFHKRPELTILIDIGTNGEVIVGNNEWLISTSASAGPALEGASVEAGMRAEKGAIEKVWAEDGEVKFSTIGNAPAKGLCGSGIIDLIAVLLDQETIDRSGRFTATEKVVEKNGIKAYELAPGILFSEKDIENVITAKAAIFAAVVIVLKRLELSFDEIEKIYLAGAFGNYIDLDSAIAIGLIPPVDKSKVEFVGNSSINGAKLAALCQDAFYEVAAIRAATTYYDLIGAEDYVEEFQKAMFLPHTDIGHWENTA
jgi:uncharacterized 2Fe-2S/4Fe-4S cluster protein (DUF4445 family)